MSSNIETFILIIVDFRPDPVFGNPSTTSRLVEVESIDGTRRIVRSEWGYLGDQPIAILEKEDEDGIFTLSFQSHEDPPRTFVSEEPDELSYVEGEVIENGDTIGEFVLRRVSDVSVDNPW